MLIAPSSEPSRRVTALRRPRAWLAALLLSVSGGCVFDLPPLQGDPGIGGISGFGNTGGTPPIGGSAGDPGGSMNLGGSAGASPGDCEAGQKRCGGGACQLATPQNGCDDSSCVPCGTAPHAVVGCVDGQCAVVGCDPNFVDCNGDTLNLAGQISGDGCEYSLGATATTVPTLSVPFAHIQVDGKRDDWNNVPSYAFEKVCSNCKDDQTEPVSADSSLPLRSDLDARFRVAWDQDKFYVFVEAFDNQLYDTGMTGGHCQQAADCEDGVQVFLLGKEDRSHGYFSDNERVFLGLSGRFGAPAQGQPTGDVEIKTERQGNLCYRIEAQVDWAYITNTKSNPGSAPGHFPPAAGQSYGFDIAVNDWDAPISDPNGIQRQSQVFWVDPGPDLVKTDAIGTMTLLGAPDAGQ